jgi:hypothetical protein
MEDILKKLELARKNLKMLDGLSQTTSQSGVLSLEQKEKNKNAIKLQEAEQNLKKLSEVSGTYDFQTIQIIGNTIPESWCPEVVSTSSYSGNLSDLIIDTDPVAKLGLGSISNQDANNVVITGGEITVDGNFNTGVILSNNSYSTGEISIRSPIINFKNSGSTNIFIVPTGYVFLINSMEIVTLEIESEVTGPFVSFGNSSSSNDYYGPILHEGYLSGGRHIAQFPQDAILENTIVTISVTTPSSSSTHNGFGIVTGFLLKLS